MLQTRGDTEGEDTNRTGQTAMSTKTDQEAPKSLNNKKNSCSTVEKTLIPCGSEINKEKYSKGQYRIEALDTKVSDALSSTPSNASPPTPPKVGVGATLVSNGTSAGSVPDPAGSSEPTKTTGSSDTGTVATESKATSAEPTEFSPADWAAGATRAPAKPKRKNLDLEQFLAIGGRTLLEMPAGDTFANRRWLEARLPGVSVSESHLGAGVDCRIACYSSERKYVGTKWLLENPKDWQAFNIEDESELTDYLARPWNTSISTRPRNLLTILSIRLQRRHYRMRKRPHDAFLLILSTGLIDSPRSNNPTYL